MHSYRVLLVGNEFECARTFSDDNLILKPQWWRMSCMMIDMLHTSILMPLHKQPKANRLLCPHPAIFCRSYLQKVRMSLKTKNRDHSPLQNE